MTVDLPDYANVTPEQLEKACRAAVEECDARVAALVAVPAAERTYANTVLALEEAQMAVTDTRLGWADLAEVADDDRLRETAWDWAERLEKRALDLGFDDDVHQAVTEFAALPEADALTGEDARYLADLIRDFRRNGFDLPAPDRDRIRAMFAELVELETAFRTTLGEWKDGIVVSRDELDGLPDSYVDGLERVDGGYRVSLDYPEYQPFMAEARSAERRRELLTKDQCKGGPENVARVERAIAVRAEIAGLLGYPSWAAYTIEPRMAKTPEAVRAFLDDLRDRAAAKAAADLVELADANERAGGSRDITLWELPYAINRLKESRYAVDEQAVAAYLPLDACLEGLFAATSAMLGVRYTEVPDAPVWHPDVRVFDVSEAAGGEPFGRFHLDLFPRPNKYKHAMAGSLRLGRRLPDGSYQRPVAAMIANFTKPTAGRPALLRHAELVTLFHEFGHVLHEVLTRAERGRYSGTETQTDFAEAPSQIMEHLCWEPAVLRSFARHHETGEPLPEELLSGLVAARTAASGVSTMRQLFFAALDLTYHSAGFDGDSTATLRDVYARYGFQYVEGTHFQSGFAHLFGYDAAMYGYLWSRSIGDDMYTPFSTAGPLDPVTGAHYRRTVLQRGGTLDADQLVRDFLGREPTNDAFLRGLGLKA